MKEANINIPTYNVVTDYCLYHSWVQPSVDKYYVATPQDKRCAVTNFLVLY